MQTAKKSAHRGSQPFSPLNISVPRARASPLVLVPPVMALIVYKTRKRIVAEYYVCVGAGIRWGRRRTEREHKSSSAKFIGTWLV